MQSGDWEAHLRAEPRQLTGQGRRKGYGAGREEGLQLTSTRPDYWQLVSNV